MSIQEVLPDFTFWSRMHAQTEGSAPHTLHETVPSSNVQRTPSCRVSCYNGCRFSFHGLFIGQTQPNMKMSLTPSMWRTYEV